MVTLLDIVLDMIAIAVQLLGTAMRGQAQVSLKSGWAIIMLLLNMPLDHGHNNYAMFKLYIPAATTSIVYNMQLKQVVI